MRLDTMHVRISLNLKSTKNNSLLVQQLPVCREQTERCRDENHLGILALCCRRPKEITGRLSFFSPSFSNISIPEIIRIADRVLRGAGLWMALLRFFARGKESVASHLDSTAAVCKAHQEQPARTALNFHFTDGAVGFDDICLISYLHGIDHVLTCLRKHLHISE